MKELVSVRIDSKLLKRLRQIAGKDERTISWLINKAVEKFLEREKTRGR
jgi:predicted transcriptional regulator